MRWLLIDEFVEIRKGKFAKGIRSITRAEESLTQTYPAFPIFSPSLMCEMMAQVGGVLVGATIHFTKEVVLAKITNVVFTKRVFPPATLVIEGRLADLGEGAARTECVIKEGDTQIARGEIFFGLFDALDPDKKSSIVFSKDFMNTFAIQQVMVDS